jgi:hypothetical protein
VLDRAVDHRGARRCLEWLNENTIADVGFFGIELEVLKIGDSLPAPAGGTWPPWPGLRMR